jgi:hypothetical protein
MNCGLRSEAGRSCTAAQCVASPVRLLVSLFLSLFLVLQCCGGCATIRAWREPRSEPLGEGDVRQRVRPAELDELTRAFADRYVGLLSSTCDALKKDNPDAVQRREAQELMLNCATNVYDIASNADAFTRTLDLVVVTELVAGVWVDDGRAREIFGDRSDVLVRALTHGRAETRALAARLLRPKQLDVLDALMRDWRRDNPDMVRMASVRFSNFAIGRGRSSTAEVLAARGWFANVGTAGRSVDEARLLTERMFYMLKRQSTLLRWEVEATKDDLFATPEAATYFSDVHRLTEMAARLPADVAAEREAIVAAVDGRTEAVDATVNNVRSAMGEAEAMAASVEKAGTSLHAMLQTADGLLRRYDAMVTDPAAPRARPFDVREYTAGVKELAGALQNMNDVLKSSDALLASAEWDRRMQDVNRSADARMKVAAEQSQVVVTAGFRQLWLTVAVVVALLIFYRLAGFYLSRRRRADVGAGGAVTAANGNGRAGRPSSLAAAGDGTLQPGVQS